MTYTCREENTWKIFNATESGGGRGPGPQIMAG